MSMPINSSENHFEIKEPDMQDDPKPSFVNCTLKYDGNRNLKVVNTFLIQIGAYKAVQGISDEDALASLPLVLESEASTWWQYAKEEVKSWAQFESTLQFTFSPKPLPYQIYQEIVGQKQGADEETFTFILNKRYLFSQLPLTHKHTEEQQIDMIFGQLQFDIRNYLSRNALATFEDLITKAREVEYIRRESRTEIKINKKTINTENEEDNEMAENDAENNQDEEDEEIDEKEPTEIKCSRCYAINSVSRSTCFKCYHAIESFRKKGKMI